MTSKWPSFVTKDSSDSAEDASEMMRRWKAYDRAMKKIIAKGGVHQDDDGWWVDDATGELIGPDPKLERPRTAGEAAKGKPLDEVLPDLAAALKRSRGRPRVPSPKQAVTLRLDRATLEKFKATGEDWRARMAETLDKAKV